MSALQQDSDKLQECYARQNDYAQRLTDAKDKQQQMKTEVASAAQAYKHYKNTHGKTDSTTIAAKINLDAYKGEYRAAVQEVKKLEGQNVAMKKSMQNAADAFSAAQTKLNGAKTALDQVETTAELFAAMAYCEIVAFLFNGLAHGVGRVQGGRAAVEWRLTALDCKSPPFP